MKQRKAASQLGPSGPNEGLHERRRRELIVATMETIAAHGLSGTTVARVADCAGLSVGIIGFYFEGKNALLLATLQHLVESYERAWREAIAGAEEDPARQLEALIDATFDASLCDIRTVSAWNAFWGEAMGGLLYKVIGRAGDDQCLRDIRQTIEELVPEGQYEGVDCRCVAETIYIMTFGHWHVAHNEAERYDLLLARKTFVDYLLYIFPGEGWAG